MTAKFTTFIAASALALASVTATPVAAKDNDALKLILGAIAIGLIAKELRDDRRRPSTRPDPIPAECVFDVRIRDRYHEVVGKRCLERAGYRRELPQDCAFEARIQGRDRTVYGARCLSQNGYQIEAARY